MTGHILKMPMILFFCSRLVLGLNILAAATATVPLIAALGFTGINLLYGACYLQFYVLVLIVCSAYEFFSRAKEQAIDEALAAVTGGRPLYLVHMLLWQLIVLALIHLLQLLLLLTGSLLNDGQNYFLSYLGKPILFNLLLPSLIGVLLAYVLASRVGRLTAYGCLFVFLLLVSPFAENLVWEIKPEGFPIDQVFNALRWPFTILYQNRGWAVDLQYGLQTEGPRLQVQLFWLLLLTGLGPLASCLKRGRQIRRMMAIAAVATAAVFLVLSFQPASLYRLNHRWDGIYADMYYYHFGYTDLSLRDTQNPGFRISAYVLDVRFNRRLDVSASLDIQADAPVQDLTLTLYRGYRVSRVELASGQEVSFIRDGDLLSLHLPSLCQNMQISLQYSGHCQMLYSNSEAAMLPGYFPWYPMAGSRQVFIDDLCGYGFNPYNRIEPADFCLTVAGCRQAVTNLPQAGDGSYAGRTDGLSLFAGQILPAGDAQVLSCLPLSFDRTAGCAQFVSRMKDSLNQALDRLESVYNLNLDIWLGKLILHPSFDLGRTYHSNQLAVFQDYILISGTEFKVADILRYYLTQQATKTDSALCDLFVNSLRETPEQCLDNLLRTFDMLESSRQMMANQGMPTHEYDTRLALREPLTLAVERLGAVRVVPAILSYMLDARTPADDQLFLRRLAEGSEAGKPAELDSTEHGSAENGSSAKEGLDATGN